MDMQDDCIIEKVTPSKVKKLKQARLTFEVSSPKTVSNNVFSKKRKLESPEECKIPKIVKVSTKGESLEDSDVDNIIPNESNTSCSSKTDVELIEISNEEEEIQEKFVQHDKVKSKNILKTPTETSKSTDVKRNKKVTPKQLRVDEGAKKRKEKEKLRMEKERRREEERKNRRKEKEKKQKEKEEKEKAEREQKKKEREQKELKKQMEMEQKQKEKEAKEQERRKREEAKEEERKKKEEEKLESERKKQKAASNFASFFVPKKQEIKNAEEESNTNVQTFMPFEIKADMRIAPISRRRLKKNEILLLDDKFKSGRAKNNDLYLAEMKAKKIITHKSERTWPLEAKDDDIIVLDEEENDSKSSVVFQPEVVMDKNRPKLLQFHENRRPPYWGTWRKQSNNINPRRPFSKDAKWFDYEVDSDEEWEEEEPGESLHGSEDEKDEENPDDNEYDVDNEFMVPHGYLSDEEARPDEEEDESMTPETQKFKLKLLGEQFEAERSAKMSKLKPKIIGCVWLGPDNIYPENTPKRIVEFLTARQAWVSQIPVVLPSTMRENTDTNSGTPLKIQTTGNTRKTKVPAEALADLIRLIHGNIHGKKFLVKEFLTFWNKKNVSKDNQISKASLGKKIGEIGRWMSCPEEGQMHLKACWYVSEDIRKKYLDVDEKLTLPNRWTYNLTPKRRSEISDSNDKLEKQEKDNEKNKKKVPLITQFTKKITQEEMKRQLSAEPKQIIKPTPILQRPPKRAVLISIPKNEKKEISLVNIKESESKKSDDSKKK
ncbi:chromatin assembly factor 1 subunit A-B-like [Vespa mandarinia]|uniref:chromatin assembly factor 1 subunit A-B-like n=1 Tax=Vespa mandarinia TaxID=7446 RepID=UPI0016214FCA|nr:chromatin assembly factor 1 subunit A-B-like [Vespa mandarinia]